MIRKDGIPVLVLVGIGVLLAMPFVRDNLAFFPFHTGTISPWKAHSPDWVEGEPSNPNAGDKHVIIYPDLVFTQSELDQGHVPLWNPHNFAGLPHQANPMTAIFYPINAMLGNFGPVRFFGLSMAIHVFLAAFFSYLYLRAIRLRSSAALAGGLCFGFSGWIAVHLHHMYFVNTMVWLPLALFAVEVLIRTGQRWALMLLPLSIGCMFLAGFPQTAVVNSWLLLIYTVIGLAANARKRGTRHTVRLTGFIGGFALLGIFLAMVQLAPTLEFSREAGHKDMTADQLRLEKLRPVTLLHLVVPDLFGNPAEQKVPQENFLSLWLLADGRQAGPISNNYSERSFYVGILALLLAIAAPMFRRDRVALTLYGAAAVSILTAMGTPFLDLFVRLGINFGNPMRFLQVAGFALPMLFACSFDRLLDFVGRGKPRFTKTVLVSGAVVMVLLLGVLVPMWTAPEYAAEILTDLSIAAGSDEVLGTADEPLESKYLYMEPQVETLSRNLGIATIAFLGAWIVFLAMALGRVRRLFVTLLVIAVVMGELLWFGIRFNPPIRAEGLYATGTAEKQTGIDFLRENLGDARFIRFDRETTTRFFAPNAALVYGLNDAQGFRALAPQSYLELMRTVEDQPYDIGLPNLESPESLRRPVLGQLRIKYAIAESPIDGSPWPQVWPRADAEGPIDFYIYENPILLPRAMLVHEINVLPPPEVLDAIAALPPLSESETENPLASTVWLNELYPGMRSRYPVPDSKETVDVVEDRAGFLSLRIEAETDGLLVVSEQFSPGWKAFAYADIDDENPEKVEILRANHCLMAFPVKKGTARVELRYEPESFKWGGLLSGVTLVFLLLVPLMGLLAHPKARIEDDWMPDGADDIERAD